MKFPDIMSNVNIDEETDCWIWKGATNSNKSGQKYGQVRFGPDCKWYATHRLVAEIFIKTIEKGEIVHHTCDNSLCINPAHLQVITWSEHASIHEGFYERDAI